LARHLSRDQVLRRVFRPRVLIYSLILVIVCTALAVSVAMRSPFRVDVLRDRASLARLVEDGYIENVYRLQIMNATESPQHYRVTADGLPGLTLREPVSLDVGPIEARWVSVALRVPPESAARTGAGAHEIHFTIDREGTTAADARSLREKSTFVLPR